MHACMHTDVPNYACVYVIIAVYILIELKIEVPCHNVSQF